MASTLTSTTLTTTNITATGTVALNGTTSADSTSTININGDVNISGGGTTTVSNSFVGDSTSDFTFSAGSSIDFDGDVDFSGGDNIFSEISGKPEVSITSWVYSTTTITLTVASHTFVAGDYINVGGLTATTNAPNGIWEVDSKTDTTIVFTAADTPTGTEGVNSATATGVVNINSVLAQGGLPVGEILQVKNLTISPVAFSSTTSGTYVDTLLTLNITPTATDSKILCLVTLNGQFPGSLDSNIKIVRASSVDVGDPFIVAPAGGATKMPVSLNAYDSLSTATSVNYKVQVSVESPGTLTYHLTGKQSSITLIETKG